jgi:hypothetical protein
VYIGVTRPSRVSWRVACMCQTIAYLPTPPEEKSGSPNFKGGFVFSQEVLVVNQNIYF